MISTPLQIFILRLIYKYIEWIRIKGENNNNNNNRKRLIFIKL